MRRRPREKSVSSISGSKLEKYQAQPPGLYPKGKGEAETDLHAVPGGQDQKPIIHQQL
jgi:hypothetical protein